MYIGSRAQWFGLSTIQWYPWNVILLQPPIAKGSHALFWTSLTGNLTCLWRILMALKKRWDLPLDFPHSWDRWSTVVQKTNIPKFCLFKVCILYKAAYICLQQNICNICWLNCVLFRFYLLQKSYWIFSWLSHRQKRCIDNIAKWMTRILRQICTSSRYGQKVAPVHYIPV